MKARKTTKARYAVVLTTVDDRARALVLARGLVERRLAACVQLLPMTSVYRWDAEVRSDEEVGLLVKTRADRVGAVTEHVLAHHPYDLPEVIVLPIEGGSAAYLGWLDTEVGKGTGPA